MPPPAKRISQRPWHAGGVAPAGIATADVMETRAAEAMAVVETAKPGGATATRVGEASKTAHEAGIDLVKATKARYPEFKGLPRHECGGIYYRIVGKNRTTFTVDEQTSPASTAMTLMAAVTSVVAVQVTELTPATARQSGARVPFSTPKNAATSGTMSSIML